MFIKAALVAFSVALASTPGSTAEVARKPASKAPSSSKEARYCIAYENITGSRVTTQECRTRSEWAKRGVDVDSL